MIIPVTKKNANHIREVDAEWFPPEVLPKLREHFKKQNCCSCGEPYEEKNLEITFVVTTHAVKWWHTRHGKMYVKKNGKYA